MHGIGIREMVALGVLVVALVFGAMFFDPLSTNGGNDGASTVSPVQFAPTSTPTAVPTQTPVPPTRLDEPRGRWFVTYFETSANGNEIRTGEGFLDSVALDVPGRPFPDSKDDAWRREATTSLTLERGQYTFALEVDGALKIVLGQKVLLETGDQPRPRREQVTFEHDGGASSLLIEVTDGGGPALLRWLDD